MPKLVKYGMLSTEKIGLDGYLVKAECIICGRKYGSLKEAKECEEKHIIEAIGNKLNTELFNER